jgi:hypothetical protein
MGTELTTGDFGMGMVTVNKEKILETLKKNREGHRAAFLEAMEGFKKVAHAAVTKLADDIIKGNSTQLRVNLSVPEDHTDEYDTVISQLGDDVHGQITLNQQQYLNFVLDKWGWSKQFVTTNSAYVGQR